MKNNILLIRVANEMIDQILDGYHVFATENLMAASQIIQDKTINVIVVHWDAIDQGIETFKEWISSYCFAIPKIVLSDYEIPVDERIKLIPYGVDYFFPAPFCLSEVKAYIDRLIHKEFQFEQIAFCDALTGVYNRRYFDQQLQIEIERSRRNLLPLSLAILDIDRFKQINDTYGHAFGDKVLQGLAKFLSQNIRTMDLLARLGGEEFIILFPETDEKTAGEIMVRLLQQTNVTPVAYMQDTPFFVTFSCGVMQWSEGMSGKQLLEGADTGLYRAKQNGRNRVELVSGTMLEVTKRESMDVKQILVVSDEEKDRNELASMLARYFKVYTASSGQEALQYMRTKRIDLAIIDDMMPGMDGFEFIKKVKMYPETKGVPTILLKSWSSKPSDIIQYINSGADDCLTKPISEIELEYRIKALIK